MAKGETGAILAQFLKVSGYDKSDILGYSEERRTFVTHSGGKYVLNAKGSKVRKILGPDTPNDAKQAAEAEEE